MKKVMFCLFFLGCLLSHVYSSETSYRVVTDWLNVRESPSIDSNVLGVVQMNDEVIVLSVANNNWAQVIFDGEVGYLSKNYITPIDNNVEEGEKEEEDFRLALLIIILLFLPLVIGILLGIQKKITVYRDYSDLAKTFSLFLVPVLAMVLFFDPEGKNAYSTLLFITIGIYFVSMFAWTIKSTYIDNNKNIYHTLLSLYVKLPLSFIFINYLISFFSKEKPGQRTIQEILRDKLTAAAILLFVLKLVRFKKWKHRPGDDDTIDGLSERIKTEYDKYKKYDKDRKIE